MGSITDSSIVTLEKTPHLLLACGAMKGSVSAKALSEWLHRLLLTEQKHPVVLAIPMADGGDGTIDAILDAQDNKPYPYQTYTTRLLNGEARWLYSPENRRAVVVACEAHGISKIPKGVPLQPLNASSYGVGQVLQAVLGALPDLKECVITTGGSSSTDGGIGCLQALGARFWGDGNAPLGNTLTNSVLCGTDLHKIHAWQLPDGRYPEVKLTITADVENPLLGPSGTAAVFAPQKGATPGDVAFLESGLTHWARLCDEQGGAAQDFYGAGAAGGLVYGLMQLKPLFANVQVCSGFEFVSQQVGLDAALNNANLVISSEGRFDETSFSGKLLGHLIQKTSASRKLLIIAGSSSPTALSQLEKFPYVHVFNLLEQPFSESEMVAAMETPLAILEKRRTALGKLIQSLL
ncbi:MAG: glycerate kinase [Cyanobacteria bacterium]|nr:glycerate kinase [Cyanobacteriota bacterium]